jgi:hypothetical protein
MSATLENLQLRVSKQEQEIATLRHLVTGTSLEDTPVERGKRLLAEARRAKVHQKAVTALAFAQMGVDQAPVPPEQLRQAMAACGIRPEENLFSRGIQELREE